MTRYFTTETKQRQPVKCTRASLTTKQAALSTKHFLAGTGEMDSIEVLVVFFANS
jgi:hypothetical protein